MDPKLSPVLTLCQAAGCFGDPPGSFSRLLAVYQLWHAEIDTDKNNKHYLIYLSDSVLGLNPLPHHGGYNLGQDTSHTHSSLFAHDYKWVLTLVWGGKLVTDLHPVQGNSNTLNHFIPKKPYTLVSFPDISSGSLLIDDLSV